MDQSAVKCIKRGVRINSFLGYLPYGWSDKNDIVTFDNSPWKRAYFYFQVLLYWSFIALMTIRSMYVTYVNSEGVTMSSRTNLQFTAVGHCTIIPFQLCTLFMYGRHHVVINRYLLFRNDLRTEWNAIRPGVKCKSIRKFCRGVIWLASINILSNVSLILRKPKAVNLITSVIPNVDKWAKWKLLPFAVIQFFISAHPWTPGYFYVTFIMGLAATLSLIRYGHLYCNSFSQIYALISVRNHPNAFCVFNKLLLILNTLALTCSRGIWKSVFYFSGTFTAISFTTTTISHPIVR